MFFPFLPWNSCLQRQLCLEKSVKAKISISMNFVAKCCQPPGILGDFAVDRWKFIDFTRPGILRPSPCTDKKWNSPIHSNAGWGKEIAVVSMHISNSQILLHRSIEVLSITGKKIVLNKGIYG